MSLIWCSTSFKDSDWILCQQTSNWIFHFERQSWKLIRSPREMMISIANWSDSSSLFLFFFSFIYVQYAHHQQLVFSIGNSLYIVFNRLHHQTILFHCITMTILHSRNRHVFRSPQYIWDTRKANNTIVPNNNYSFEHIRQRAGHRTFSCPSFNKLRLNRSINFSLDRTYWLHGWRAIIICWPL